MNEKIEIVNAWIEKADHDLDTAAIVHIHLPAYHDTIAFHCQQASEKYLKGFLVFLDIPFKRQHSLVYLLDLISEKIDISTELYTKAAELEDYAIEIRYPDTKSEINEEDILHAINITREIREFITGKMKL